MCIPGAEYIEALTTDQGAVVSYHCKLCDCSFTDPAARLSHLNGRRHLLMYNVRPTFLPAPLIQFVYLTNALAEVSSHFTAIFSTGCKIVYTLQTLYHRLYSRL